MTHARAHASFLRIPGPLTVRCLSTNILRSFQLIGVQLRTRGWGEMTFFHVHFIPRGDGEGGTTVFTAPKARYSLIGSGSQEHKTHYFQPYRDEATTL
jgi:hypothetical protein